MTQTVNDSKNETRTVNDSKTDFLTVKDSNEFNPYRKRLIDKGIISGEDRGYVKFELPMFEEYVQDHI